MTGLEKVLKGLECCADDIMCPDYCPYKPISDLGGDCREELVHDALELLKTQIARTLTLEEVKEYLMVNDSGLLTQEQWKELGQRPPLYLEFLEPDDYQVNWFTTERLRPWVMEMMFQEKYNVERRCWTARPTDKQREETPWTE